VVSGVLEAARRHDLNIDSLSAADVKRRFPGFQAPADCVGVLEPAAGYLRVEACVLAHLAAAERHGAKLEFGVTAHAWRADRDGVTVTTDRGVYSAGKLILAAGPWAPRLLSDLGIPLVVRRKHLYWFRTSDDRYEEAAGCPTFLYELPQGIFYGFPQIDALGVKAAEHSGGAAIGDPASDPRALDPADLARVETFLTQHLPGVGGPLVRHSVCFYTMSPDEHFVVGRHPQHENVALAAGLSGHGFKFTSVLGEALADLALDGSTRLPIEFLSPQRLLPSIGTAAAE
jgi:monomeric sarcosine oxidase